MNTITKTLTKIVSEAFEKCGYDASLGSVMVSDRMDLCQFQCNGAFAAAKKYRKAPFVIAGDVASVLGQCPDFKSVDVAKPGFINMTLTDEKLVSLIGEIAGDRNLGVPQAEKKTVVLDYGGPNVAKPLHIGHLRSAIIGEAIKRIARASGYTVYGDTHLGDWGLQMGLVIAELEDRNPGWDCFRDDFKEGGDVPTLTADELNEIYPFASQRSKQDPEFAEKAHRATAELQARRPGYIALWKEIMRASVTDMKKSYEKLNVEFDLWYGESDADRFIPRLMDILDSRGLLRESDGAMVVDVAEDSDTAPVPPVIVKKSDGSSIYATTDLATIIMRMDEFSPDEIWYVTDNRQGLHFKQVFRCAEKAALTEKDGGAATLGWYGFGTMNGSDGKPFKTRDGGVMRLEDLISMVTSAAAEKLDSSGFVSGEERDSVAQKVGVAALKFGDLINYRAKDYVFDPERFLAFEGKTGTYLLYTITRINSILGKVGRDAGEVTGVYTDVERELMLSMLLSGEAFRRALDEKAPNYICESAYQIATVFSRFYHDNHIANEQDAAKKSSWIALCGLTKRMLEKHLEAVGIETVEHM